MRRHRDGNRVAFIAGPEQTQHHLQLGINLIADMLAPTLGPTGAIVANQQSTNKAPELLDDSATAVRRVLSLGDQRMDVGAMLLRNLVWRVTGEVGDGGATTAVLARALYREVLRLMHAGFNPVVLDKGVRAAGERVVHALQEQARPVTSEDELSRVALSVIREPDLAAVLGEVAYLLGPDAWVNVERYVAAYLESEFFPGVNYAAQIASYYLYTEPHLKRAIHGDSAIVLIDGGLLRTEQAIRVLEAGIATKREHLLIVAHNFRDDPLQVILRNQTEKERPISIAAATLKLVGEARQHAYEDLALLTGATVLGRGHVKQIESIVPSDLGRAQRIEIDTKTLQVVPHAINTQEVQIRIEQLEARLAHLRADDDERTKLTQRLSALRGGMGVVKVGAPTKAEREVRARAAERGLKVLSATQKGGALAGCGAALLRCRGAVETLLAEKEWADAERAGIQAVARILDTPLRQILTNSGEPSPMRILAQLEDASSADAPVTYNALTGEVTDAWQNGVLDPADVVIASVRTAISGAMMALSTDTIVYHRNPRRQMEP